MVLETSKQQVEFGIEAARSLLTRAKQNGRYSDADLWILAQGFFNGFTSVIETLRRVEANRGDPLLQKAVLDWLRETNREREVRLGNWRNLMTHQGKSLTTLQTMEWETDEWNDTVVPVPGHVFAEVGHSGGSWTVTFDEWALHQFNWLDRGLRDIEAAYNRLKREEERKASFKKPS